MKISFKIVVKALLIAGIALTNSNLFAINEEEAKKIIEKYSEQVKNELDTEKKNLINRKRLQKAIFEEHSTHTKEIEELEKEWQHLSNLTSSMLKDQGEFVSKEDRLDEQQHYEDAKEKLDHVTQNLNLKKETLTEFESMWSNELAVKQDFKSLNFKLEDRMKEFKENPLLLSLNLWAKENTENIAKVHQKLIEYACSLIQKLDFLKPFSLPEDYSIIEDSDFKALEKVLEELKNDPNAQFYYLTQQIEIPGMPDAIKQFIIDNYASLLQHSFPLVCSHTLDDHAFRAIDQKTGNIICNSANETYILDASNNYNRLHNLDNNLELTVIQDEKNGNIISSADNYTIKIFDVSNNYKLLHTLTGHTNSIKCIIQDKKTDDIISCAYDKTIKFWDASDNYKSRTINGNFDWISSIIQDKKNGNIIIHSNSNTIQILDASNNYNLLQTITHTLNDNTQWVHAIIQDENTGNIISCSQDKTIKIWDASNNYKPLHTLKGHTDEVYRIIQDKKTGKLISGSEDNTIRIWDPSNNYKLMHTIKGHGKSLDSIMQDKNTGNIISYTCDQTIKVWKSAQSQAKSVDYLQLVLLIYLAKFNDSKITLHQDWMKIFLTLPKEQQDMLQEMLVLQEEEDEYDNIYCSIQ